MAKCRLKCYIIDEASAVCRPAVVEDQQAYVELRTILDILYFISQTICELLIVGMRQTRKQGLFGP